MSTTVVIGVALLVVASYRLEVEHSGPLVLGTIDEVSVVIHESPPEVEDRRPLRIAVNVGSFSPIQIASPGVYRTTYRLPATRHPQVALVALWRETGPGAPIDFQRIPLFGKTTLPVGTREGARVTVLVGEQTFGPITADRRGNAVVPIEVPPGVLEVVARSAEGATETQKTVPVDLPPYNRLTLAVTPYLIEADGRSSATVHVYYDVDRPPPIDQVAVSAPRGQVERIGADASRYRFRFVPERGESKADVVLETRVQRDRHSSAKVTLSLGTPIPQRLVSTIDPAPLVTDGVSTKPVQILLMDRLGLGVPRTTLTASAAGARCSAPVERGGGKYELEVRAPPRYPASGRIRLRLGVADHPALAEEVDIPLAPPPWPEEASITIDPERPISDGSTFTVEVLAKDQAGRGFESGIVVTAGGSRVGEVQNLGGGRYRADVTPPDGADSVELRVTDPSGRFSLEHRATLDPPPSLMFVGAKAGAAYHRRPSPSAALEVGVRLPVGERRITLAIGGGFRRVTQDVALPAIFPEGSIVEAQLLMFPVTIGGAYDLFTSTGLRIYAMAALAVVPFRHTTKSISTDGMELFDTPSERGVGLGGEGGFGLEVYGILVEAGAGYTWIRDDFLRGPDLLIAGHVGYRLGFL
jgi:hypothetical protein